MLAAQYAVAGLSSLPWVGGAFTELVGWVEIAVGLALLLRPWRNLLLVAAGLKIGTELLYPLTGAPIWEFIERGGTYVAPLALFAILSRREGEAGMHLNGRERILIVFTGGLVLGLAVGLFAWGRGEPVDTATALPIARPVKPPQPAVAPQKHDPALRSTVAEMRNGGFILYFRHAQRHKWDTAIAFDVFELATGTDPRRAAFRDAVCLSAQGQEEARMIGSLVALAGVPVGPVLSSPSCRARETAQLAFGRIDGVSPGLVHWPVTNAGNAEAFRAELQRVLVSAPIVPGKNTVITAHGNTLENHPDIFVAGRELIQSARLSETGFYVIRRDSDGALHVVQKFQDLGVFAANAIDLAATGPS
jgi:hypothetical protein